MSDTPKRGAGRPKTGRNFIKINVSVPKDLEAAVQWAKDNGGLSTLVTGCLRRAYLASSDSTIDSRANYPDDAPPEPESS